MDEQKLRNIITGLTIVCIVFFLLWYNASISEIQQNAANSGLSNKAIYGWISALSFVGMMIAFVYSRYLEKKRLLGNIAENLKGMNNATNTTENESNKSKALSIVGDAIRLFSNNRYYGNNMSYSGFYPGYGKTARATDARGLIRPLTDALGLAPAKKSFGVS